MAKRVVPGFQFDPRAIELARQRMRPPTDEEVAERARAVQALAADVADVAAEVAGLPSEASESAEQARVAVEEFEAEHALTLERARAGVRDLVAAAQDHVDAALESLLPDLVSGEPLPAADRRRVLRLLGRVRRVEDLDAAKLLLDRLEELEVEWSDLEPEEAAGRAERARRCPRVRGTGYLRSRRSTRRGEVRREQLGSMTLELPAEQAELLARAREHAEEARRWAELNPDLPELDASGLPPLPDGPGGLMEDELVECQAFYAADRSRGEELLRFTEESATAVGEALERCEAVLAGKSTEVA